MEFSELNDDIWDELISYLNLKCIYSLEFADNFFKGVLKRTKIWERKLKKEFPDVEYECNQANEERNYQTSRKLYWNVYIQRHKCNFCKLCLIDNVCRNIPECKNCNWLEYLD